MAIPNGIEPLYLLIPEELKSGMALLFLGAFPARGHSWPTATSGERGAP